MTHPHAHGATRQASRRLVVGNFGWMILLYAVLVCVVSKLGFASSPEAPTDSRISNPSNDTTLSAAPLQHDSREQRLRELTTTSFVEEPLICRLTVVDTIYQDPADDQHYSTRDSTEETACIPIDPEHGESNNLYTISLPFAFEEEYHDQIHSGRLRVSIRNAVLTEDEVRVGDDSEFTVIQAKDESEADPGRDRRLQTTGILTIAVVSVSTNDSEPVFDAATLQTGLFERSVCLRSQYLACSFGQLQWESNGVYEVFVNDTVANYGSGAALATAAQSVLAQTSNVKASDLADKVMFAIPPGTGNWVASAGVGHWRAQFNSEWILSLTAVIHELAHTIGLLHSQEGTYAYGDATGYMAAGYTDQQWPQKCFNGHKNYILGWYQSRMQTVDPYVRPVRVDLAAFVDYDTISTSNQPVLISILDKVFLQFNRAKGFNQHTEEKRNQVTVTYGPTRDSLSTLLAGLDTRDRHEIDDFDDSGRVLVIEACERRIGGVLDSMVVSVGFDTSYCDGVVGAAPPVDFGGAEPGEGTISLNPTSIPTQIPSMKPTRLPTAIPSPLPTSRTSTQIPSMKPTRLPTAIPSHLPTRRTSGVPSESPSISPSQLTSEYPSTASPSNFPTTIPSRSPTLLPSTSIPSLRPTRSPTRSPSADPTRMPDLMASTEPQNQASEIPTGSSSLSPSESYPMDPTGFGAAIVSSISPSTSIPTDLTLLTSAPSLSTAPSRDDGTAPTVRSPIEDASVPSFYPSLSAFPSNGGRGAPPLGMDDLFGTLGPTKAPTLSPSRSPSTEVPSLSPTRRTAASLPTTGPVTPSPVEAPIFQDLFIPHIDPTQSPTLDGSSPTDPTIRWASDVPLVTDFPTLSPTGFGKSEALSDAPSDLPSDSPSDIPSDTPSYFPSDLPSGGPSILPSIPVGPTMTPLSQAPVGPPETPRPTPLPTIAPSPPPTTETVSSTWAFHREYRMVTTFTLLATGMLLPEWVC